MPDKIEGIIRNKRDLGGIVFFDVETVSGEFSVIARKDESEPEALEQTKNMNIGDFCRMETVQEGKDAVIRDVLIHIEKQQDCVWDRERVEIVRAYAFILNALREFLIERKYTEVRLPSIHFGKNREDFRLNFFGQKARLTASNSLFLDVYAVQLQKAFSIQKSFRAEKSKTSRHLAEFDMLEAACMNWPLDQAKEELEELVKFIVERFSKSGFSHLFAPEISGLAEKPFRVIEYKELEQRYRLDGKGLGKYEREIAKNGPVFVMDFPRKIASWTARPVDETYSRNFNLLLPGVGEVAEGTEKETNKKRFKEILQAAEVTKQLQWYIDMIPYENFRLSGFGLGVERLAMWLLGLENIRKLHPVYRDTGFSEL